MQSKFLYFLIFMSVSSFSHAEILESLKKDKDESPLIIEAEEKVVCDEGLHYCTAVGLAKAQKGTNTIYGDVLKVYFTDDREITSMTADGNVRMETPTDKAFGDHAHYDVALDRVLLTGKNLKIVTPKETLTARDSIEYWHKENKGIAKGNAIAVFPEKGELIQADTLIAYFKSSEDKTNEGEEKQSIDHVDAEGNVLASSPKGVVTGERGVYRAKESLVEVFDNVKVVQGENIIEGGYARYNLKTSIADMFTTPPKNASEKPLKRIYGIILPGDAKKMKEKKDKESSD